MTPEMLRELERLAALAAASVEAKPSRKRRVKAYPSGPVPAYLCWERCVVCECPVNALEGFRRDDGRLACPRHAQEALHGLSEARTLCTHCRQEVASGVWEYGGTAFGHAWTRQAALCAECGFGATDWVVFTAPSLPKKLAKRLSKAELAKAVAALPSGAPARYVQWCRLVQGGREAASVFAKALQERTAPKPEARSKYDMSKVEAALEFIYAHGLAQRPT